MLRLSIRFSRIFIFWRVSGLSAQIFIFFSFLFNYYFLAIYQKSCFWFCQHSDFWKAKLNLWLIHMKASLDSPHVPFLAISFTDVCILCRLLCELCWVHAWLYKCHRTDGWTLPVQSWLQASTATGISQNIFRPVLTQPGSRQGPGKGNTSHSGTGVPEEFGQSVAVGGCSDLMPLPLLLLDYSLSLLQRFVLQLCESQPWSVYSLCWDWTHQKSMEC